MKIALIFSVFVLSIVVVAAQQKGEFKNRRKKNIEKVEGEKVKLELLKFYELQKLN